MRSILRSLVLVTLASASCATFGSGHTSSTDGLPSDGAPAVIFAPGVISTGDVFASTFTPDGRTVVFTRFAAPMMTLMSSHLEDGRWSTPAVLPFSGVYRDLDPAFSPDGSKLYFSSWRPSGPSAADTTNAADTWVAEFNGTSWSAAVRIGEPVSGPEMDYYPSVTNRGVLYFDSFRSHPRQRRVYRAEPGPNGTFREPVALDATINADSGASNLFVDPDERYVVFGAARPEGAGGIDLYISWRTPAGWTPPRNLGPTVNTAGTEFCPFVSRDGSYLYFTRVSPPGVTPATRNIYVVRFDALRERLKL